MLAPEFSNILSYIVLRYFSDSSILSSCFYMKLQRGRQNSHTNVPVMRMSNAKFAFNSHQPFVLAPTSVNKNSMKGSSPHIPRNIWMYWHAGKAHMPVECKMCHDTYRKQNPQWTITVVSEETLPRYMDPGLARNITQSRMRKSLQADLIRIYLLARYGGVWADLTTICTRPLDNWIQSQTQAQLLLFTYDTPCSISSWWLACPKASKMAWMVYTHFLRDIVQNKWQELPDYFHFHAVFEKLCRTNAEFQRLYRYSPRLSSKDAHKFQDAEKSLKRPLTRAFQVRVDSPFSNAGIYKLYGRSQGSMDVSPGSGARYLLDQILRK